MKSPLYWSYGLINLWLGMGLYRVSPAEYNSALIAYAAVCCADRSSCPNEPSYLSLNDKACLFPSSELLALHFELNKLLYSLSGWFIKAFPKFRELAPAGWGIMQPYTSSWQCITCPLFTVYLLPNTYHCSSHNLARGLISVSYFRKHVANCKIRRSDRDRLPRRPRGGRLRSLQFGHRLGTMGFDVDLKIFMI